MNLRKIIILGVLGLAGAVPGLGAVVEIPAGTTMDVSEKPGEACQYVVEGTMNATAARDIINYAGASITVKNGGVLNISCETPDDYSSYPGFVIHQQATVTVSAGGLLDVKKNGAWGYAAQGLLHLDGGVCHAFSTRPDRLGYFRNVRLSNGARVTGGSIGAGWCQENWSDRNAYRGTMLVDGSSPSFIDTDYFTVGGGRHGSYESVTGTGAKVNGTMGLDLTVDDVTGDAESDLVVNALLTVYTDFADWPADKLYLTKTGAGTVEFAGGIQNLPALRLDAGTALVRGTGSTIGRLIVTGDATLAVAEGAEITLGALEADGGTLTLDADLSVCRINVASVDASFLDAVIYQGQTEALAIEDGRLVSTLVSGVPVIGEVTVEVDNVTTAVFTAQIADFGDGATVDLYVALGLTAETLGEFVPCGTAEAGATAVTGRIQNLEEGVTYCYQAKLRDHRGGESRRTRSGSFRTMPVMETIESVAWYSGLLQGKVNASNDFTTDLWSESVIPVEVVPGAVMADLVVGNWQQDVYTNPYTDSTYNWNAAYTTFGYSGDIYLIEGTVLNVGKNIDDSAYVKIGETIVLEDRTWNNVPISTFTVPHTGWYPIEIRVGDDTGGKGVCDLNRLDGHGLAYNFGETTDSSATGWKPFVDERHDGSFLRCHHAGRRLQMSNVSVNGDDVTVWLGVLGEVSAGTTLKVYYGDTDCGDEASEWGDGVSVIATVAADGLFPATKYTLKGFARYGVLRFAVEVPGSATVQGLTQVSPAVELSQVAPVVDFDFDGEATADAVKLMVSLTTLGINASTATIWAEVSTAEDFSDAKRTRLADVRVTGKFQATLSDLTQATSYWIRLVSENNLGQSCTTEAKTFETFNPDIAHPGDRLVWAGGANGVWSSSSVAWQLPNGGKVAWLDGCTAVFVSSASVTVEEDAEVVRIEILDDARNVTLRGPGAVSATGVKFGSGIGGLAVENTLCLGDDASICCDASGESTSEIVIRGNLDFGLSLAVKGAITLRTAGEGLLAGGIVTGDLTLADDAVLELASTAEQTMKGKITVSTPGHGYVMTLPGSNVSFTSNQSASWELCVAGDTYIAERNTYPQVYNGKGQTRVLAGGTLRMGRYNWWSWGPNVNADEGLFVEDGGVLRLLDDRSLGWQMGVTVNGGVMTNEASTLDCLLNKCQLNDGATLTGRGMRVGVTDDGYSRWSYIKAGGSKPSTVSLDELQVGFSAPAKEKGYVGINFIVNDVTKDGATDLLVTSPITERTDVTLLADAQYRANLGVWKQGEGTLELTSGESCCTTGVFKVEAGTVRFPRDSGGSFGALLVLGGASVDVKRGAKVEFEDSSEMAWTEGATLSFTGDFGRRDVRVGTSADALTAEQLAAIQYVTAAGKTKPMTLDDEGYLQPPAPGMFITVR